MRKTTGPALLVNIALLVSGLGGVAAVSGGVTSAEASTTTTRTVALTARASTFVDKNKATTNFAKAAVRKVGAKRFTTYVSFAPLRLAAGEKVAAVSLRVRSVGGSPTSSTGIIAKSTYWLGSKITYKTRPKLGGSLSATVKASKGKDSVLKLSSSAYKAVVSSAGLSVGVVHSKATARTDLSAKSPAPRLVVAITKTVADPTVTKKLVFAHYHPQYPISLDEKYKPIDQDFYTTVYLNPHGEGDKYLKYGGYLRDRPLPEEPTSQTGLARQLTNFTKEISDAKQVGIDGFAIDMWEFTDGGQYFERARELVMAAKGQNFKIMLQPDVDVSNKVTAAEVAKGLVEVSQLGAGSGSIFTDSAGEVVVSPFNAESRGPAFWSSVVAAMKSSGVPATLWPLFVNWEVANPQLPAWSQISIGISDWGGRNPKGIGTSTDVADRYGKLWMQPVAVQDARPHGAFDGDVAKPGSYEEAGNSETLRTSWSVAMGIAKNRSADMVMLTTWNDYGETSGCSPSVQHGYALLDLDRYYVNAYKAGISGTQSPVIDKEALFISHRKHAHDTSKMPISHPIQMLWRSDNMGMPPRDTVEVLTFLKSPSVVTVKLGSSGTQTYTAPAGVYSRLFALPTEGVISASYARSGAVATTSSPVLKAPTTQDMGYLFASTLR